MNHEVIPCSPKICDWPLNSSWDHFGLHQGKKCQSDHEAQGPQKVYFQSIIIVMIQCVLCHGREIPC